MSGTIHAFDFLAKPDAEKLTGVCPLFGGERFLKRLVINQVVAQLGDADPDFDASEFDGNSCSWADVIDE